jgi:hypothetical protein
MVAIIRTELYSSTEWCISQDGDDISTRFKTVGKFHVLEETLLSVEAKAIELYLTGKYRSALLGGRDCNYVFRMRSRFLPPSVD